MSLTVLRPRAASFLAAVLTLSLPAVVPAQDNRASGDPEVQAAERLFSAWLESRISNRNLPGVVVGVVADQDLIWAKGFGYADVQARAPMTPETKFRMASHSKLFTATAIMQLREQGKLGLDDPVSKYLPWFKVKSAEPDDPPVTIEQLLTHSSGLPREAGPHWTSYQFPTETELKSLMPERQAAFPPEVRFKYSNLAYTLAGMVVEAVSGQRWADYITQNIYAPLGMKASSIDQNAVGLAVGYGPRLPDGSRRIAPFIDARGMAAATGITSTVGDMAKFVSAQFRKGPRGGPQILSTGSLREMHRIRVIENTWTSGNAIGFAVRRVGDKILIGHGGGYPGYTTQTLIRLDGKVGVIVLTNTNDSDPSAIAVQLMNTVGDAVAKATAQPARLVAWDPAWARFAGRYSNPGGLESQVVLLNQRLAILSANADNVDNVVRLEPLGNGLFRFVAPVGGGPVGETVRFVEENGRVVRMITGDSYVDRVN